MSVLVDSSSWIDYFRNSGCADTLDLLIEENRVATNELILAELIPPLEFRRAKTLISLLREIRRQPMDIYWDEIVLMQTTCVRNGINGVGIPDLLIAQNAIQGSMKVFTKDKHFPLMARHIHLDMYT